MMHFQVLYADDRRALLPLGDDWPSGNPLMVATTPPVPDESGAIEWCDAHGYPAGPWSKPELVEGEPMMLDYKPAPCNVVNIQGKAISLTFTLALTTACLLLACTTETPMEQPRGTASTITTNVQPPYDHADPATPPKAGWFQQDAGQPPTILTAQVVNDVAGELLYLQDELGYPGYEAAGDLPNRDALAQVFEQRRLPGSLFPLVSGTDAINDRLAFADINQQQGMYRRVGPVVMVMARLTWTNTDPARNAMLINVDLPFQLIDIPSFTDVVGTVQIQRSNFRAQNGPIGTHYYTSANALDTRARVSSLDAAGGTSTQLLIGNGGSDGGPRLLQFQMWYRTDGVRNTRMPVVSWVTRGAAVTPLGSPEPTLVEWRADGLVPGDEVRLYERVTVPSPADVLVPGGVAVVANTPKDRGTFDLSALGVTAGNYKLKISRTLATQPELAEFESALLAIPSV